MDCRKFRDEHALLLDGECSELDAFEMRSHMRYCESCARYDATIRRGLLVVRNLPAIEPSEGFRDRLNARLRAAEAEDRRTPVTTHLARYAAVAAMISGILVAAARAVRSEPAIRMAPVVAALPAREPSPFGNSTLVATIPTGMSIWPAIMMASQAPAHIVSAELATER